MSDKKFDFVPLTVEKVKSMNPNENAKWIMDNGRWIFDIYKVESSQDKYLEDYVEGVEDEEADELSNSSDSNEDDFRSFDIELDEDELFNALDGEDFVLTNMRDYRTNGRSAAKVYSVYNEIYQAWDSITINSIKELLENYLVGGVKQSKNGEVTFGVEISGSTMYQVLCYFNIARTEEYRGRYNDRQFAAYIKETMPWIEALYNHFSNSNYW